MLDDDDLVRKYYQQFKTDVVAHFENSGWTLTDDEVIDWLRRRHDGHVEVLHR